MYVNQTSFQNYYASIPCWHFYFTRTFLYYPEYLRLIYDIAKLSGILIWKVIMDRTRAYAMHSVYLHSHSSRLVKKLNPIDWTYLSQYLKLPPLHQVHIEEFCPHPDIEHQKFCALKYLKKSRKRIIGFSEKGSNSLTKI